MDDAIVLQYGDNQWIVGEEGPGDFGSERESYR